MLKSNYRQITRVAIYIAMLLAALAPLQMLSLPTTHASINRAIQLVPIGSPSPGSLTCTQSQALCLQGNVTCYDMMIASPEHPEDYLGGRMKSNKTQATGPSTFQLTVIGNVPSYDPSYVQNHPAAKNCPEILYIVWKYDVKVYCGNHMVGQTNATPPSKTLPDAELANPPGALRGFDMPFINMDGRFPRNADTLRFEARCTQCTKMSGTSFYKTDYVPARIAIEISAKAETRTGAIDVLSPITDSYNGVLLSGSLPPTSPCSDERCKHPLDLKDPTHPLPMHGSVQEVH